MRVRDKSNRDDAQWNAAPVQSVRAQEKLKRDDDK